MEMQKSFGEIHFRTNVSLRASAHAGVAIRIPIQYQMTNIFRRTDCHTSDIGHWFEMTYLSESVHLSKTFAIQGLTLMVSRAIILLT